MQPMDDAIAEASSTHVVKSSCEILFENRARIVEPLS